MKTKILTWSAVLVLASGIGLRAQQSDEGSMGTMSGADESKRAMVDRCRHMCAVQLNPESPASLLAWKEQLELSADQADKLRSVEEKAISDAKALMTAEQLGKLKALAQDMKPQSMMHMQGMMHGMKGKMGNAMPMCCSPMQGKTEE